MNYGRNAQFARTQGWDMHWGVNSPGDDLAKVQRDNQKFLVVPNIAATAYLPYGPGITAMAGVFGPALGYEISRNIRAARNPFASKPYAFVREPSVPVSQLRRIFGMRHRHEPQGDGHCPANPFPLFISPHTSSPSKHRSWAGGFGPPYIRSPC
jgi:hypothetical protein